MQAFVMQICSCILYPTEVNIHFQQTNILPSPDLPLKICVNVNDGQRNDNDNFYLNLFQMAPEQECLQYHTAAVREKILERIGHKYG